MKLTKLALILAIGVASLPVYADYQDKYTFQPVSCAGWLIPIHGATSSNSAQEKSVPCTMNGKPSHYSEGPQVLVDDVPGELTGHLEDTIPVINVLNGQVNQMNSWIDPDKGVPTIVTYAGTFSLTGISTLTVSQTPSVEDPRYKLEVILKYQYQK